MEVGRKLRPLQRWRPELCTECHRKPLDGKLRRGLCLACYERRRRLKLPMPAKLTGAVLARKKIGEPVYAIIRQAWDRFR